MGFLDQMDWEGTRERFEAFWRYEAADRACVCVTAPEDRRAPYQNVVPTDPDELRRYYTDAEWVLARNLERFQKTCFAGDAFPCIFPYLGTGGHAKYLTSRVEYRPDTIWIHPTLSDYERFDFAFDPANPTFQSELQLIRTLAKEGCGRFFVSPPDNCGSLDALAQLRGASELNLDFIDQPEQVLHATRAMVRLLALSGDAIFEAIRENNLGGSVQGWMNLWAPGKLMQLQCDLSVMISPETFEKFVMPELEKTAAWLTHAIYHLDGQEQLRHLDALLSLPAIRAIQWVQVSGQPPVTHFFGPLRRIQAAGKGLILFIDKSQLDAVLDSLSPRGLMLLVEGAEDRTEAEAIVRHVAKYRRRPD